MRRAQTKRPLFGAFSFTFIYCWYNTYWRYFEDSPVAASLHAKGFPPDTLMTLVSFGAVAGIAISLCSFWPQLVTQKKWPIKLLVHLSSFLPFQMFALFSNAASIAVLGLLGGFCIGTVTGRSFYTMFFELMDIHPAKIVVVGYAIIQTYVHLGEIVSLGSIPFLYYSLEAMTLLVGLVLSYLRLEGEEMERRRILPENRFRPADIWQILGMIVLIQSCLTLYEFVILHQTIRTRWSDAVKILPTVMKLLFLALLGKKLTLAGALTAFLALFVCGVGAFIVFGQDARVPVQLFTEPAYGLVDFLFVWILVVVFYTYGRNQFRLKACIIVFFTVRFATIVGCGYLFSVVAARTEAAFFVLLPAFIAALLIRSAERAMKSMEAQRAYAEEYKDVQVPLPPEREEVRAACESLLRTLPADTMLTEEEKAVLAYLVDGQYTDVTGHFMGIPTRHVGELIGNLKEKFGVKSSHELLIRLGTAQADLSNRAQREELFARYSLTEREREVCSLLLKSLSVRQIAGEKGLAFATVNGYYRSLYRKLGISSKGELFAIFGTEPVAQSDTSPPASPR